MNEKLSIARLRIEEMTKEQEKLLIELDDAHTSSKIEIESTKEKEEDQKRSLRNRAAALEKENERRKRETEEWKEEVRKLKENINERNSSDDDRNNSSDSNGGKTTTTKEETDGGNATVTPANFVNGTSITFDSVNDTMTLLYQSTGWIVLAQQNTTVNA